jgi:uncharacterized C2H2 Zn-finger protein
VYSDMRAHRRTHGLGPKFGCPSCGKVFACKRSAEDHQRVHTKERPYGCSVAGCGLAFRQRKSLAVHLRSVKFNISRKKFRSINCMWRNK